MSDLAIAGSSSTINSLPAIANFSFGIAWVKETVRSQPSGTLFGKRVCGGVLGRGRTGKPYCKLRATSQNASDANAAAVIVDDPSTGVKAEPNPVRTGRKERIEQASTNGRRDARSRVG